MNLIHELEVNQIELALQNEQLVLARSGAQEVAEKYNELYDFAPSGFFSLSKDGEIIGLNLCGSQMLGKERSQLIKSMFSFFISDDTKPIFNLFLRKVFTSKTKETCEVAILTKDTLPIYVHITGIVSENMKLCYVTMVDISERRFLDDAHNFLLQCGHPGSSESFFESLARYLAQSLNMDYVCIDRLEGNGLTAKTVAIFSDGKFETNLAYTLKETPCGEVVGKTICCFPEGVCHLFPFDTALQDLKAESYIGTTLWSFDGKPIGLIAVIGRKPLRNPAIAEAVLKMVAIRSAGELERTVYEAELLHSRQRLELAQRSSGAGLWDWDMVNQRLTWSNELYYLFGMNPEQDEATFESWGNIIHPDDKEIARLRIEEAIHNKTPLNSEYRVIYNGQVHWINALGDTTYDESDRPIRMTGICIDITKRKQSEDAMRESEERLRTITDNAPDIILELDRQGRIVYMNRVMTGFKMEDVIGRNFCDWVPSEDHNFIIQSLEDVFNTEMPQTFQTRGFGFNGELRWFHANLSPVKVKGKVENAIGIVRDITERKQAEETLREAEVQRLAILQTAMDGFWLLDLQGRLVEVNETYCRMSGYSAQELLSMHISDLEDVEAADATTTHIQKIVAQGEDRFESRHRRKDSSVFDVEVSVQYQAAEDGQLVTFLHDITERKHAEKGLKQLYEELEERVKDRTAELLLTNDALKQTEQKYRTVADFTYGWEFWLDLNGNFLYCSPACERITGYNASAFVQNPRLLIDIIHPDDIKVYHCHQQREEIVKDSNHEFQYRIVRVDGTIRWIGHVCQPLFDESGKFIGIRGSNKDITVRKEMEKKLKTSEQQYKLLSENISDGIFICKEGRFEYLNKSMSSIFGYDSHELVGLQLSQLTIPDYQKDLEKFLTLHPSSNQIRRIELECTKKDLSKVFVEMQFNYIATEGLVYGVAHDITEKKQIQKNIVKAIIQTEEKERAHFSKELHDGLGPLLSLIKLYIQWTQRPKSNKSREEIMYKAEEVIDEALVTVKEISNKLSPHVLTYYGLTASIQSFADKLGETSSIRVDFRSNATRRFDAEIEAALYRAIIECFNNTIKYASADSIKINLNDSGSQLQLQYNDDGKGFNLNETLSLRKGLGLFNLQNRIHNIGGKISMFSEPGKGVDYRIIVDL